MQVDRLRFLALTVAFVGACAASRNATPITAVDVPAQPVAKIEAAPDASADPPAPTDEASDAPVAHLERGKSEEGTIGRIGRMFGVGDAGVGGLGLRGTGVGGLGGATIGLGSSPARRKSPLVSDTAPMATGTLPSEVIRRVLRQNFGRFRFCYETALRTQPGIAGSVVVKFTIGKTGSVSAVSIDGSTLPNKDAIDCVARSVKGTQFPSPDGGGVVRVTYPLRFEAQ